MEILNRDMQVAKRDKMRHLPAVYRYKALWGVRVGVAIFLDQSIGIDETFFLGQSIDIDKTNTFQLKFFIYHANCGRHRFRRFVGVRVGVALPQFWAACGR